MSERSTSERPRPDRSPSVAAPHPPTVDTPSAASEVVETAHEVDDLPPTSTGLPVLQSRFNHLLRELGKFGTVGGVAFAADLAIFNALLAGPQMEKLLASTISMTIAASIAFVGNRFWTWRDRERSGLRREYALYFIFNLIGLLITLACLGFSTYVLGSIWPLFEGTLAANVAKVIGTGLATIFRFWSYRNIVFRASS